MMSRAMCLPYLVSTICFVSVIGSAQKADPNISETPAVESGQSPSPGYIAQSPSEMPAKKDHPGDAPLGASTVPLGDAVLTIHGVCGPSREFSATKGGSCATVVTRHEFEALMNIVASGRTDNVAMRQTVARMYAELLAYESAAQKAGIPDTPEFRWTMQLLRLRSLADSYRHALEKQYSTPSGEEIEDYYRREVRRFEEVQLRRIVLPKNNFSTTNREDFEKKALQVAGELRERAAKGEDVEELQKEAFSKLGFQGQPPATSVGNRRRASLLPAVSDEIFGLEPGRVSKVESEPASFVIYKVEAKHTLSKQMVTAEIAQELAREKVAAAIKATTQSVDSDLNEEYFGSSTGQSNSADPVAAHPH